MDADTTDDFQKELVDLFVQEAQEWLQNIHVALDELQQGPAPERHITLVETISAGVTNLSGSSATLNLPDVQQASFAAIPFIEALQNPQKAFSVQDFLSLCKQLGQIHTALTRATGISFIEERGGAAAGGLHASLSPRELLQSLRELQAKHPSSIASEHMFIRSLIEQMDGQIQAGVEHIDATVIQEYLARVSEAEESFLKAMNERVPEIVKTISALTMDGDGASALESSLQDAECLRTKARQVNAEPAVMFFTGLHSLLTVVVQRRVHLAATRVESVKARLHVVGDAMRQWVEDGRAQHVAIDQLLSAGRS